MWQLLLLKIKGRGRKIAHPRVAERGKSSNRPFFLAAAFFSRKVVNYVKRF